jgi:hypothetical protein
LGVSREILKQFTTKFFLYSPLPGRKITLMFETLESRNFLDKIPSSGNHSL